MMDAKSKRILNDECKLTDQISYEIKAGGIPAEIYGEWIVELKSELQLWKNQAERNALTHQDIDLMCKDMLELIFCDGYSENYRRMWPHLSSMME